MDAHCIVTRRRWLGWLGVGLTWPLQARAAETESLCIVVGQKSPIANLELEQLKAIFLTQRHDDGAGHSVVPLNHPARSVFRTRLDQLLLGLGPDAVADYWIERRRRRQPGPPRSVPSIATLRRVLARLPETLGYLPRRQLTNQVRVLRIDGKVPEDSDYPIRVSAD